MKKLLLLAGIVAGTVAPHLPAYADPHDHPCVGPVDTNCVRTSDGRNCDVYEEDPAGSTCVHDPRSGPDYSGGCSFATNNDPSGQIANPGTQTGVISGTVLGFDSDPAGNPATTTVECWIEVNGSVHCYVSATGVPIASASAGCSYTAADGDVVDLCQIITVNGTTLDNACYPSTSAEFPPQEFWDIVDPIVCEVLITIAPITNPIFALVGQPVHIDPATGDVFVTGELFYDCLPYA